MPPGRKNKRGDHGSTEESHEKSTAKRYNMADNGAIEAKNSDGTPYEEANSELSELNEEDLNTETCGRWK